jgi:CCR4-NOT transcription complex subunit 9
VSCDDPRIRLGSELSKTVATFIVQKILLDDLGLGYICATYERYESVIAVRTTITFDRFFAVSTVLSNMVAQVSAVLRRVRCAH